ncbi:unnamed protein product [Amoebophrya sp. A25]|nr:unnamed protein product [Amoebophrya sp. A25]|eukprot:GSA25T00021372001.1
MQLLTPGSITPCSLALFVCFFVVVLSPQWVRLTCYFSLLLGDSTPGGKRSTSIDWWPVEGSKRWVMREGFLKKLDRTELVKKVGPARSVGCLWRNLLWLPGQGHPKSIDSKSRCEATSYGSYDWLWSPPPVAKEKNFDKDVKEVKGITMIMQPLWTFNVGHGIFDELFPAFAGFARLLRYGNLTKKVLEDMQVEQDVARRARLGPSTSYLRPEDASFSMLMSEGRSHDGGTDFLAVEYFRLFTSASGSGHLLAPDRQAKKVLLRYAHVGSTHLGQRSNEPSGTMLAESWVLQAFRNRFWKGAKIKVDPGRACVAGATMNVVIVYNKRYNSRERSALERVAREIHEQKQSVNSTSSFKARAIYLDWGRIREETFVKLSGMSVSKVKEYLGVSPEEGLISRTRAITQLRLLAFVDVYVSGPGTGLLNHAFLRDGAVTVNLGEMGEMLHLGGKKKWRPKMYMEEYFASTMEFQRGLYYPRCKANEIEHKTAQNVISEAIRNARNCRSNYTVDENSSPVVKAFRELMKMHNISAPIADPRHLFLRQDDHCDWIGVVIMGHPDLCTKFRNHWKIKQENVVKVRRRHGLDNCRDADKKAAAEVLLNSSKINRR